MTRLIFHQALAQATYQGINGIIGNPFGCLARPDGLDDLGTAVNLAGLLAQFGQQMILLVTEWRADDLSMNIDLSLGSINL